MNDPLTVNQTIETLLDYLSERDVSDLLMTDAGTLEKWRNGEREPNYSYRQRILFLGTIAAKLMRAGADKALAKLIENYAKDKPTEETNE